jgi:uncharacterized protein
MKERSKLAILAGVLLAGALLPLHHPQVHRWMVGVLSVLPLPFLPTGSSRVRDSLAEAFLVFHDYARPHVFLSLIPALFVAGAICTFIRPGSSAWRLLARISRRAAYSIAAASGAILGVCSCTILPLFQGIRGRGVRLGPAAAFLYAGPAINLAAVPLTLGMLGPGIAIARVVAAIVFSCLIGILMQRLFPEEETEVPLDPSGSGRVGRSFWQDLLFFSAMLGILVFANRDRGTGDISGPGALVFRARWILCGLLGLALLGLLVRWFARPEWVAWTRNTWTVAERILPLIFAGVFLVGMLLGRPFHEGLFPTRWVAGLVGDNWLLSHLFAALVGAFMYFGTLAEVPVVQTAIRAGLGPGPALTLLLAGPAVSLPSMIALGALIGAKKTLAYVSLVVASSMLAGMLYGAAV